MKVNLITCFLTFFILASSSHISFAQSTSPTDYFRSKISGSWNSISSWESSTDGATNWISATLVPSQTANIITIRSGHTITINTNTTVDQVQITTGGILELATSASTLLTINDGVGNDVIVQNGGIFRHKITGTNPPLPSFVGSASMEIQGGGTLEVASNNGTPSNYAVTTSSIANNIIWADNSIFNWNTTSSPLDQVTYFPATAAIAVFRFSSPASIGGTAATVINGLLEANANVNFQSTGTKTIRNGIIGTGTVAATAVSVGQIIVNGATAKLGGGTLVLSDAGLLISAGTEFSLISNKTINKVGTANSPINLSGTMLAGDYIIDGTSTIQINGTLKTTNANGLIGSTNTTFAGSFNISSFGSNSIVEYNRLGDQVITPLSYANVNIYGSGTKKVIGTSDMGITGTLDIAASNIFTLNGINQLNLNGSSTLNINANSIFDNGGESRIKGGLRINILGTFITRSEAGFSGATLSTIAGATSSVIVTIYDGSVIEFGRAGDQTVISRNDFYNMTFSGSGTKTLPTMVPYGTVTIEDDAIVDASNKTFGNENTNLTMTGGRFKVAGLSTKPDIAGIYNLSGGVIEFAGGSASSRQNIRSTPLYLNIEVSGMNVGNSSSSTKMANGGSFTVKTGGSYENSGDKIDGTSGTQSFTIETGGTFKTGVTGGFSGSSTSALYNIENISIDPKSTIIYSRNGDQTITPLTNCPSLLLKGSGFKTLSNGSLNIAATADSIVIDPLVFLKISAGARADFNNRPVTIHSNTNGNGGIGEITDGAVALLNATKVTVERFIPAKRAFRFLTSSVTTLTSIKDNWMEKQNNPAPAYSINNNNYPGYGTHITGSADPTTGFDATATNNPSVFMYNNGRQAWETLPNTNSTMTAGFPYRIMVRGNRDVDLSNNIATPSNTILRTTGSLQIGTITCDKKSYPSISTHPGDYSFLGNPYASAINWDLVGKSNVSGYYYVWDPNLNTRGAYAVYGNNITNPSSSAVNQYIQSGQGFFVETTSPNPSIIFQENNKAVVNRNVFRSLSTSSTMSIQLLFDTTGVTNVADGITVMFDDSYSTQIGSEDAAKFKNLDENMSIESNATLLSIDGRPTASTTDSIQMVITDFRQKNYYFKIKTEGLPAGLTAVIKDKFLKKEVPIDIRSETIVPFEITDDSSSYNSKRFIIILRPASVLQITMGSLKAYKQETGIMLDWHIETENNIEKYEIEKSVDGERFNKIAEIAAEGKNNNANYSWIDNSVTNENNFYRIKYITKLGTSEYSNEVLVKTELIKKSFTIFPNPVKGSVFYVSINDIRKSTYTLSLYNNSGQKMYSATIGHAGGLTTYKISIGKVMPEGNYRLQLNNGKKNDSETLVFQ